MFSIHERSFIYMDILRVNRQNLITKTTVFYHPILPFVNYSKTHTHTHTHTCSVHVASLQYSKCTLPVPDILSISILIPYYTNVRKLCRYYNIFEFISLVMYNVESILLSSYVVWRNDLLIHTMLLDGFTLLQLFVTPAGISMGIKLWTEFFPIL